MMKKKANCAACGYKRTKKDYVQQSNCELGKNQKNCDSFVNAIELKKYKEMMSEMMSAKQ